MIYRTRLKTVLSLCSGFISNSPFQIPHSRRRRASKASALITTLLVLVVLSTIVVAFMQSMSIERSVARSSSNAVQATLLADAAMDVVLQRLQTTTRSGPYAAVFDQDNSGSPYLYLAKREVQPSSVLTRRIPLFSTAVPIALFDSLTTSQIDFGPLSVPDLDRSGAVVTRSVTLPSDVVCNINATNASFPTGIVGLMNGANARALPVNWVYVRDSGGRVIGRYAAWTDDECSKLDLRFAGQAANSLGTHLRGAGTNLSDLSLLALTNSPSIITSTNASNLLALRNMTNFNARASYGQYQLVPGAPVLSTNAWDRLRPYVTVYSLHDDRSPDGKRKLNLNTVVSSTNTAAQVQKEVFAIRDAITNNLPDFGLRYYSSPTVPTGADRAIYATKLAANIRDYIDTNSVATIIQADGSAFVTNTSAAVPSGLLGKTDLLTAFGKENGPFLSEYFRITRVISPTVSPSNSSANSVAVTVRFCHYIELYNPTGQTIRYSDLGTDPHILLTDRVSWNNRSSHSAASPAVLRLADLKIRLPSSLAIAPGGFAVLTTDGPPWQDSQMDFIGDANNRYVISAGSGAGQWELINSSGKASVNGSGFEDYNIITTAEEVNSNNNYMVQNAAPSSPTYSEQLERLTFATAEGIIDMVLRIYTTQGLYLSRAARNPTWISTFPADSDTDNRNTPTNSDTEARFSRGDARANTEISDVGANNTSASWKAGGGAYGNNLFSTVALGGPQQTLGGPNYKATTQLTATGVARWRQWWYEFTSDSAGNHYIPSTPIRSIGELGSVSDPVRYDIRGFRSQGATLRLGQSDSGTNNRANNTNSDYVNWLGGRGSDVATNRAYMQNAFLLMDVFRTDDVREGRVNPNSIVRDSSALAFRAVLDRFVFENTATNRASATLGGLPLNATNTLADLRSFATNGANGLIVSVGDLSRAPSFWSTNTALAGISMQGVSDAGKEEFLRRSANLLTTQSLAFTVYVRGQAGEFVTVNGVDQFKVKSSSTRETVVQLIPSYASGGDPTVPIAPTGWTISKPRTISY